MNIEKLKYEKERLHDLDQYIRIDRILLSFVAMLSGLLIVLRPEVVGSMQYLRQWHMNVSLFGTIVFISGLISLHRSLENKDINILVLFPFAAYLVLSIFFLVNNREYPLAASAIYLYILATPFKIILYERQKEKRKLWVQIIRILLKS